MSIVMPLFDEAVLKRRGEIVAALKRIVPGEGVIASEEAMRPYESDGLTAYRQLPMVVVLPETTAQVAAVLAYCHGEGIKVVPRGAGTSLSGGALPLGDGVLLGLAKFNHIREIDYDNRVAVVEPGVTNLAVSKAVEEAGFYYAPDPSSQIACTIGGNIAENSGGVHCLKYGMTTNNVLGCELVLITGEIVRLGGKHLDSGGYDLLGIVTGSEGLLGVVTEVTVRILKRPQRARALRFFQDSHGDFGDDPEQALGAGDDAEEIVAAGIQMLAAEPQHLAGHQHQFAAEQVIGGHAVFEAMHAAGILRHIAADGAGDLRRRIGGVIEAGLLDRLRHREIGDAGLDHGDAIVKVDLADALELGHAEQHAVAERQRAARQRGPGPARHHLDAFAVAVGEHSGNLRRGLRQHHHHGQLPIGGKAIALVRPHGRFRSDHALARHDALERRDDLGAARKNRAVVFRHCNGHKRLSLGRLPGRVSGSFAAHLPVTIT